MSQPNFYEAMSSTKLSPEQQILLLKMGFWKSRALAVATEMGLPDILAEKPLSVDDLASRTAMNASALFRLLRALESIGVFSQPEPRVFANTPISQCLREGVPKSQRPVVLSSLSKGNGLFDGWDELGYAMKTGTPSLNKLYGHDFWELCKREPKVNALFNEMMRSLTHDMTPAITSAYEWDRFSLIADIGGGIGTQLISILDAFPCCRGILFDQPHVLAEASPHDRIENVEGNFFEHVPKGADAYLLRWILHDWAEPEVATILKVLHQALKPTASLILAECVISDGPEFSFGKWLDLQMLVSFGGRERTESEYQTLLLASGFELQEVVPTTSPLSLIIATPKKTLTKRVV
ncbi:MULTISPECIES: methyltransferase [Burkholderiaceae]|uniref:methyltransferase n=1 Tax=Burkholderiaceae TaxID=119060 RepID=UPI0009655179|nr:MULTISPECIES: methyltransferase [Burkholderiaceae]MCG1018516.1 hypothetical protein [Mycetohabitans sp. B4]SIT79411.1 Dimerisation domain-containing protein [Burkholderia sp. b13]